MDISTVWDPVALRADWVIANGDLVGGNDLATAVTISLLTDRRADPDDAIPDGTDDRRGWCGDDGADIPIGSKLWLRRRLKRSIRTLQLCRGDVEQALEWLTSDGVAKKVVVKAEWLAKPPRPLIITVDIHRKQGGVLSLQYAFAWEDA